MASLWLNSQICSTERLFGAIIPQAFTAVFVSGGLPIRQNRQLPKARHGAGARTVHCEFFFVLN